MFSSLWCGCHLAVRQRRRCGIMLDSNLLVHEGWESSAWVALCTVAVPPVLCLWLKPFCAAHKKRNSSITLGCGIVSTRRDVQSVYHNHRASCLWTSNAVQLYSPAFAPPVGFHVSYISEWKVFLWNCLFWMCIMHNCCKRNQKESLQLYVNV